MDFAHIGANPHEGYVVRGVQIPDHVAGHEEQRLQVGDEHEGASLTAGGSEGHSMAIQDHDVSSAAMGEEIDERIPIVGSTATREMDKCGAGQGVCCC